MGLGLPRQGHVNDPNLKNLLKFSGWLIHSTRARSKHLRSVYFFLLG